MPHRLLIALLFTAAIQLQAAGQTVFETRRDSLFGYWASGDTAQYYSCLLRCVKQAADTLRNKDLLISLVPFIDPDPVHSNAAKDAQIREIAMRIGNKFDRKFGDYGRVRELYETSHAHVQDKILLDERAWYVENPLGSAYTRLDDFEAALHYYSLTKTAITQGPASKDTSAPGWRTRLCANLGTLMWSRGDTLGAIREFKEGLELAKTKCLATGIQANAAGLAEIYCALDSFAPAMLMLQTADSALLAMPGDDNFLARRATNRLNRADLLYRQSRMPGPAVTPEASLPSYTAAITDLTGYYKGSPRREIAKAYTAYAKALLQADSITSALDALARGLYHLRLNDTLTPSLPMRQQLYQENTFIELFDTWSRWHDRQYAATGLEDHLVQSVEALSLARYANELILLNASRDPSKLIAIRHNRDLIARELERTYRLYQNTGNAHWLARARELFSRSKSLLLDEKMKESRIIADLPAEKKEWLREWQSKLLVIREAAQGHAGQADSLSRERFRIETEIGNLVASVQRRLSADTVSGDYIEYVMTGESIYAMADLSGRVQFARLGSQRELDGLLGRLNDFISLRGASFDTAILADVFDFLVRPLTASLPRTVTIIPDGRIAYLPFDLLKDPAGRLGVETSAIAYAYSYTSPAHAGTNPFRPYAVYCQAPEYPRQPGRNYEVTRGTFYHLPYARLEVDALKKIYRQAVYVNESGVDTAVLRRLPEARIFHYTGHALARGDHAFLALDGHSTPSSTLTEEEISLAGQGPELVVLSACETGLGKLEAGEGIRSLGRSFLEAGARAVVMSLWAVSDRATTGIMIDFHRRLRAGEPVQHALRGAKIDYLATAKYEARSPYFWAGFVAVGDMAALQH